ncbi:transcriptional regulator [Halogeometricum borinquense]|uniref:Transcriptional regulator n=1 Tax=Halogeometricum borinquense TaxID=60847 RepID=A0A6C0UFH8_9EURY|nr:transcriptional regulator [Halogeometricum borinquense]QIB74135.1 transcriptional regulator [Halogeometricum borinquense]QIQ76657.1 transcriptional regulator [Halogeometricum borinquense]
MNDLWDTAGYIASSRYRVSVCKYLDREGPELPSRIASKLGFAQPHVSRALSELRDRNVVELLVPESQQKGRLYGLTREGKQALTRLRGDAASVSVSFVEERSFPYDSLIDHLCDEHDEELRLVVARNGDDSDVFVASEDVQKRYDEQSIARLIAALRAGETTIDDKLMDVPTGENQFAVRGLEHSLLVRFSVDDDAEILVALEPDADVNVPAFIDACRRRLKD